MSLLGESGHFCFCIQFIDMPLLDESGHSQILEPRTHLLGDSGHSQFKPFCASVHGPYNHEVQNGRFAKGV